VIDTVDMVKREPKKITTKDYHNRRRGLMSMLEPNSIAILPGAVAQVRNADVEFRFRQDSNFHYLTGFAEPDAVLALIPGREYGEVILFCRERDHDQERWHGAITGPDAVMDQYGIDDAFPIADIDDILPGLIEGRSRLYYPMGNDLEFDSQIIDWVKMINSSGQKGAEPPGEFIQLEQFLHELRLFKSAA